MLKILRSGAGLILLAALTLISQSAMALGLGNSSVESYLNQPFRARIDLIGSADDDIETITASLASADDFALIGASLADISVPLRFSVVSDDSGNYVMVTSNSPVRDPIIRIILELNWASGRMLREYTMFLDPPSYSDAAPSPVIDQRSEPSIAPPVSRPEPVQDAPAAQPEAAESLSEAAPVQQPDDGEEYGPVQSGDTLWRIAIDWKGSSGLAMNKVMLTIQRNNPQAFINGNINLLKRGAILRMPDVSEVRQMSSQLALEEVIKQNRAASQGSPVATAVETPLIDESSQPPQVAQDSSPEPEEPDTPSNQLELVPPSVVEDVDSAAGFKQVGEGSGASTAVDSLREELARKEEELIIEQQQNQNLEDRISELESQLNSDQEGTVADDQLSQVEQQLRDDRLAEQQAESVAADETPPPSTSIPQVSSSSAASEDSGFGNPWIWLIGFLVVAATAGWFFSRRKPANSTESQYASNDAGTVSEIKGQAEEILKVLDEEEEAPDGEDQAPENDETDEISTGVSDQDEKLSSVTGNDGGARPEGHIDEAMLLDEDSVDPEVRLDLARAYISMGDREAARVILEEVIEHGDEKQKAEAEDMLKEF
jgi:pilus assembly protein FimV